MMHWHHQPLYKKIRVLCLRSRQLYRHNTFDLYSKLFTTCLNHRLSSYVENMILVEEQAGFRKGYSTTDHVFGLHTLLLNYTNKSICIVHL